MQSSAVKQLNRILGFILYFIEFVFLFLQESFGNEIYNFILVLEKMGLTLSEKLIFPDHHQYSSDDHKHMKKLSEKFDYLIGLTT